MAFTNYQFHSPFSVFVYLHKLASHVTNPEVPFAVLHLEKGAWRRFRYGFDTMFYVPITRDPATAARVGGLHLTNVKSGTYGLSRTAIFHWE